jgi:hypothetical protein
MTRRPARETCYPVANTEGSRSERSEESEDPPQADRSSTRVRIAQRDGDAGETGRAPDGKVPGNPKITGRFPWSRRESNPSPPDGPEATYRIPGEQLTDKGETPLLP